MADDLLTLAPKDDLNSEQSGFQPYREHLDQVYRERSIRNIALIGNRGSGKSSILRSYDKYRHEGTPKFLFVSLIDFEEGKTSTEAKPETAPDPQQTQKRLEYSLLCQILARCTGKDLRGSSLSGIPEPPPDLRLLAPWLTAVFALAFGLMFEDRAGSVLKAWGWTTQARVVLHGVLYLILGALLCAGVFWLLRAVLPNIRLQKLSLKGTHAEAELALENGKYCLDQFKFEIIHILNQISDKIGCTVVFEDMERLDTPVCVQIMTKLRELNALVNTHRLTLDPFAEPVRFLYALSDEVFDYEARTKFFDTIVPVIPVLNAANSAEHLKDLLRRHGFYIDQSYMPRLLTIVAPQLTDYRTAKNVVSEFSLLKELCAQNSKLDMTEPQNYARLFALTVYKVLFPREYGYAFKREGYGTLPLPGLSNHPAELVEMAKALFDENYLDSASLDMVGRAEVRLEYQRLSILRDGSSKAKNVLLSELINQKDDSLREKILRSGIFDMEKDCLVVEHMGRYLFRTPGDCLDHWLDIRYRSVTHFVRDTLPYYSGQDIWEEFKYRNSNPVQFLTNTLNALSSFSVNDLQHTLDLPRYKRAFWKLSDWLNNNDFERQPDPIPGDTRWEWLWNTRCGPVLALCLGKMGAALPDEILNKRFAKRPLRDYLAEHNEAHPQESGSTP